MQQIHMQHAVPVLVSKAAAVAAAAQIPISILRYTAHEDQHVKHMKISI